jgi:extradiol dioxygenase family protein
VVSGYWLYSGDQPMIHLLEDANRQGEKSGFFDHIALRCSGLTEMISTLENNSIDFFRFESKETSQIQLFISDPSGTTIELNFFES